MTHHSDKQSRSRFRFIGETIAELKKVVWPTKREAAYLTVLVLIIAVSAGLLLGGVDWGFAHLVNKLLLGG